MLAFINQLFDKCIFTITFILGVQLPAFIDQYTQRLSGHLNEAQRQLDQFQYLAQLHHQGDLTLLIRAYRTNSDPSVVDTALIIEQLMTRVGYLAQHLQQIQAPEYLAQLKSFVLHYDLAIAQQTAKIFTLAIPLEMPALITGASIALTFVISKALIEFMFQRVFLAKKSPVLSEHS